MTFEPPIPLCSSGKFVDNYFFLRCVHVDGNPVRLELLHEDTMLWQFFRPDSNDLPIDSEGLLHMIEW